LLFREVEFWQRDDRDKDEGRSEEAGSTASAGLSGVPRRAFFVGIKLNILTISRLTCCALS